MRSLLSRTKRQTRIRRAIIVVVVAVAASTSAQPANVLAFFNTLNPNEVARNDVMPLPSSDDLRRPNVPLASNPVLFDSRTPGVSKKQVARQRKKELVDKRTSTSKTYLNTDGTNTLEYSSQQRHYQKNGKWEDINNAFAASALNSDLRGAAGAIQATMRPLSKGIEITYEGKTFEMFPIGARNATPVKKDDRTIIYKDAWPGVNIEYQLRGEMVKELIYIKNKSVQANFNFTVKGAKILSHPTRKGELAIEGTDPNKFSFSSVTLDVNGRGVISEERVTQRPTSDGFAISLDTAWLKEQPYSALPMVIDPTFYRYDTSMDIRIFKSDGYSCDKTNCYINTGTAYDKGWKYWRSYFSFGYNELAGKKILNAQIDMPMAEGIGGETAGRWLNIGHANCVGYACTGQQAGSAYVGTYATLNFTNKLQERINAGDFGAWWSLWGGRRGVQELQAMV